MIFSKRTATKGADPGFDAEMEGNLAEALGNFRSSVHSWNDAEFARARTVTFAEHRRTWRSATAWALGCVLAAGSLSAGMYEHQHRDRMARMAAERQAAEHHAQQEQAVRDTAEQTRLQDERLMAAVDQDVSQEVPSAMEPLADLMDGGAK